MTKPTNKQTTYRKSLIQKIQIVKSNVFLDDEQRKEFMLSRFGVDSTTKMNIDELKLLLDFCNRKVSDIPLSKATEAQVKKIYDVWFKKARNKALDALYAFIFKITKESVNSVSDLTYRGSQKMIVALEKMK